VVKVQCPKCKAICDTSDENLPERGTYIQCRQCRHKFPAGKEDPDGAGLGKFETFFLLVLLIVPLFYLLVFVFKINFFFALPALIGAGLLLSIPFLVKPDKLKGRKKD